MTIDFSLEKYTAFCNAAISTNYKILPISDYLLVKDTHENKLILRHDVDRCPKDALRMAQVENQFGIRSTYYFRAISSVFKKDIVVAIAKLGHEIGYHYETLAETNGDYDKALELFKENLVRFREITSISTISMHGRPFSRWDSRLLWDRYNFTDLGISGEAYLSVDYNQVAYFCDTGRTWHSSRFNIRDNVAGDLRHREIETTDQLIQTMRSGQFASMCISFHPNRWPQSYAGILISMLADAATNLAKTGIRLLRTPR
jgi:hypothetical protein